MWKTRYVEEEIRGSCWKKATETILVANFLEDPEILNEHKAFQSNNPDDQSGFNYDPRPRCERRALAKKLTSSGAIR